MTSSLVQDGIGSRIASSTTDLLIYTLGFVFLNTGLALYFHLSVLLANMFLGAVLVNINRVSFRFFESLRNVDSPLYLLFFVLVGANLEIGLLRHLGALAVAYIILRALGKIAGVYLGGTISDSPPRMKKYLGFALLPQAGVALGVALIAKGSFPEYGGMIFSTIVTTTIIYEIIGPLFTKFALHLSGEI